MFFKPNFWALSALVCIGASSPASAQHVFKCGPRTYSELPCSKRIVNTDQAPVRAKPNPKEVDLRRIEQNRVLARTMRPRAGETAEQFATRRHRARLMPEDREECARLDTRIPVEKARMNNPDPNEVLEAETALKESSRRFREMRC